MLALLRAQAPVASYGGCDRSRFLPGARERIAEYLIDPLLVRGDDLTQADADIGFELLDCLDIWR